ncbi:MAG: ferritin family protein [Proteobacteria bacterium]|nr:ferritin family protein [Pseudomonadota bacterium]
MDRISSIKLAIKNETSEMAFYLNEARRSENPVTKALFGTLAEDEKEHMQRIRALNDKLVADGSWPKDMPIEVKGTNIKAVLKGLGRNPEISAKHNDDDLAALRTGIEFENNGAKFYSELAEISENPQEAGFFRFLADIEREHMMSIQDSLFYLEDPQGWLESKERSGLDGA